MIRPDREGVLTLNAGSSSLKVAAFRDGALDRFASVEVSDLGHAAVMTSSIAGQHQTVPLGGASDHEAALAAVFKCSSCGRRRRARIKCANRQRAASAPRAALDTSLASGHGAAHRGLAVMRSGPCDALPVHMQAPLEITFRGMAPSPSVEAAAAAWVARLDHLCDRIQHCHVWIDLPHRHHRHGASFQVKIDLTIPGAEIAVTQDGDDDVYVVLADAFLAVRRQLHDRIQILRGDVKHHAA